MTGNIILKIIQFYSENEYLFKELEKYRSSKKRHLLIFLLNKLSIMVITL